MTDRIKGYLVTLEGDIRDDDAECIENAIKMIKGVHSIKKYVKKGEDYMAEWKARQDTYAEFMKILNEYYEKITGRDQK